jgi:hypothetical protein
VTKLWSAKQAGLIEYGLLAERYVREFDAKWRLGSGTQEPLLGNADVQSLADLASSVELIENTRVVPFSRSTLVRLVAITLLPLVPLVFLMIDPAEQLQRLLGILL